MNKNNNDKKQFVYVVGGCAHYVNWLEDLNIFPTTDIDTCSGIFLTGGEDIDSSWYSEFRHPFLGTNINRDKEEKKMFEWAVKNNKWIAGSCRGAQGISIWSGSKNMVQHQENTYIHDAFTYDGKILKINSTHHNAVHVWNMPEDERKILAWSIGVSRFHQDGEQKEIVNGNVGENKELEVVYYPKKWAIGFQMHLESLVHDVEFAETIEYFQNIFRKFLKKEL